jgi:pimeloyl-ACP methyl ester carboxylesterase
VLTPELRDLSDYRITQASVQVIRDAVQYLSSGPEHVVGGKISLIGFSFAGGLSLVALEDPHTATRLSSVTSVGGHHDLKRVLRFLIHDEIETPHGIVHQRAHEYGLVVLVYGHLEEFVPLQDLHAMRDGFRAWLQEDRPRARAAARARSTPEAQRLWELLEAGRLQELAPRLDALLESERDRLASLSPAGHLQQLHVPVYLLHGAHDSVIPPSETVAADLELRGTEHDALVSPLLEHVEVGKATGLADEFALVSFLSKML